MYEKQRASFEDVCRVISTLLHDKDPQQPFDKMRTSLIKEGIIPGDWVYKRESPVTKGMLAYMLCKVLDIKGGLTMRIFGTSQRYALRECKWIGLITRASSAKEYVSGKELLAIFTRASVYKKEGSLRSLQ
jgi:hypothetical protein